MIEHMFGAAIPAPLPDEPVDRRAHAHALLDTILDAHPSAPGPVLSEAVEAHGALTRVIDGQLVHLWPQWEASCDWAGEGCSTPTAWVLGHNGTSRVDTGVIRKTALLAASMPHVSAAAAAGWLPMRHLQLLTRARTPEVAERFDRDEELLVHMARRLTADAFAAELQRWRYEALADLGRNDPDRHPDTDSEADTATIVRGFGNRGILRADLSPESFAAIVEAIEARIEKWRRAGQLTEDDRSYTELVGAALVDLIVDGSVSTRHAQLRPLLIVHTTLTALFDRADVPQDERDAWRAEILGGGPIGQKALRRLAEQANIQVVITDDDGEPLYVGRTRRLATAAQMVALYARSKGRCEFTGCHASHHRCHAHHIIWWEHGGRSDIDNFALLCPHHHRLIHPRGFTVTRGPTGLEFRTPQGHLVPTLPYQPAA